MHAHVHNNGGDTHVRKNGGDTHVRKNGGDTHVRKNGGDTHVRKNGGDTHVRKNRTCDMCTCYKRDDTYMTVHVQKGDKYTMCLK